MAGPRDLFTPKLPEMPEACVSCPFRDDNDEEFGKVIQKLIVHKERRHVEGEALEVHTMTARQNIKDEVANGQGEFGCHCSSYTDDMKIKPIRERRQCPGATAHYKATGPSYPEAGD